MSTELDRLIYEAGQNDIKFIQLFHGNGSGVDTVKFKLNYGSIEFTPNEADYNQFLHFLDCSEDYNGVANVSSSGKKFRPQSADIPFDGRPDGFIEYNQVSLIGEVA